MPPSIAGEKYAAAQRLGTSPKHPRVQSERSQEAVSQFSLDTLLTQHRGWVLRRCMNWLRNRADAEDVTQDVLLRVCLGLRGLKDPTRFHGWLARIVDNQCKTYLARRRLVTVEHIERLIDLYESVPGPEDTLVAGGQVRLALDHLPPDVSYLLELRFFQDLSLEQIAHRLGISLSAAKMRLYRAQDRFAAAFTVLDP